MCHCWTPAFIYGTRTHAHTLTRYVFPVSNFALDWCVIIDARKKWRRRRVRRKVCKIEREIDQRQLIKVLMVRLDRIVLMQEALREFNLIYTLFNTKRTIDTYTNIFIEFHTKLPLSRNCENESVTKPSPYWAITVSCWAYHLSHRFRFAKCIRKSMNETRRWNADVSVYSNAHLTFLQFNPIL